MVLIGSRLRPEDLAGHDLAGELPHELAVAETGPGKRGYSWSCIGGSVMSVDDPTDISLRQIPAEVGGAITVVSATIDDAMAQAALRSTSPASGGSVLIRAIHHFALVVNELDASIAWYSDILGFGLERRFGFPEVGVDIAHIVHPTGIRIELIQQTGSTRSLDVGLDAFGALKTQGAKHIGLLVEDIEGVAATLKAKGVEIVHDVTAVAPAGVRNFWIRDNSGNLIEFNQWL